MQHAVLQCVRRCEAGRPFRQLAVSADLSHVRSWCLTRAHGRELLWARGTCPAALFLAPGQLLQLSAAWLSQESKLPPSVPLVDGIVCI